MSNLIKRRNMELFPAFRGTEDWDNFMTRMFGRTWPFEGSKELLANAEWAPAVDIEETPERFMVKAELPGVEKKDMEVTVENGVLTLKGERRKEVEEKNKKIHRIERSYGMFMRSFTLPEGVDEKKVLAEYKDGLLTVSIPKTGEKPATRTKVEVK